MPGPRPAVDAHVEAEIGRAAAGALRRFREVMASPSFIRDCRTRYVVGQGQYDHRYEWLDWPETTFAGEIYTEILDAVIYQAMARVAADRR